MPNYANSVVYTISCNDSQITDIYVGCTTNFVKRKSSHKSDCNNSDSKHHHFKVYQFIRDNQGWGNWTMAPLHKFPCKDKMEQAIEERRVMKELGATLNGCIPGRTMNEWYLDNKEKVRVSRKIYQSNNKEKIAARSKLYRDNNVEACKLRKREYYYSHQDEISISGKTYYKNNSERIRAYAKIYTSKNKEGIKEKGKLYHEKNKEKIRTKKSQKVLCSCGATLARGSISCHFKSPNHREYESNHPEFDFTDYFII